MRNIPNIRKIITAFLIIATVTGLTSCIEVGEMRSITSMELVADMELGINLGNTLDSHGNWLRGDNPQTWETGWGSPVITQEMIDGFKAEGFNSIRIPVTWYPHLDENNIISEAWMNRVQEIVDYAYNIGMYVIINVHHDGGTNPDRGSWVIDWSQQDYDKFYERYEAIWKQIAERFRDYSDYLIFESLNEVGFDNLYRSNKPEAFALLTRINQDFVDIIRASGGNNKNRHLLIAGYWTDIARTCDELFQMPVDSLTPERLILSLHYYTPAHFAIIDKDEGWGEPRTEWGDEKDIEELEYLMNLLKINFIDNGVPIILGEFGCTFRNKEPEQVRNYILTVAETAYKLGMCPMLWETNCHFNRREYTFWDKQLGEGFRQITANGR